MEDHTIPQDSSKNHNILIKEDEREKVKDFVYRHFREVTDGSLLTEHGNNKKDKPALNKAHCKVQQGAFFSGKILSFGCSECKDNYTYSPNDLLKHFRTAHHGTLPTYPCDLCGFVTNEFPALQRHRIEHRNTLVTCELCHDGVQYSLLLLTRHYIMCHSVNGQFTCDWCEFTTVDAGTFVQHIHHHKETSWKCLKCSHISLNEEDHPKHFKAYSGTFPLTCQICGYGSARNDYFKKHIAAVHKSEKKTLWTPTEDNGMPLNSSTSLRLLLKKNPPVSDESEETPKLNIVSGSLPNQNGRLVTDDVHQLPEGTVAKSNNKNCNNSCHNGEQSAPVMLQEADQSPSSNSIIHTSPNGLTVLRVKNKLSIPPNCTTKVIGFKVVDGKKHLVLKVIQTAKPDVGSSSPNHIDHKKHYTESGECSNGRNSTLTCLQADDIMAVKVKVEEEETSVSHFDSSPHETVVDEQSNPLSSSSMAIPDTLPMTNNVDHGNSQCHQTAYSERTKPDLITSDNVTAPSSSAKNPTMTSKFSTFAAQSSTANGDNCGVANEGWLHTVAVETTATEIISKNGQHNVQNILTNVISASSNCSIVSENCTQNLPNQEVFTFHNYSKETSSTSLIIGHNLASKSESAERESESPHFSLTLAESPEPISGCDAREQSAVDVSYCALGETVSTRDVEVDECIAGVEVDENPESVLQDFNIIKIEEDSIPIAKPQSEINTSSSVGFVEDANSDANVHKQLNEERSASAGCSNDDSAKQKKATVRILQLPESKQPVLLRTAESRFAMPVQVKATPGFKLITNSTNPQINVSYIKPAAEKTANPSVVFSPNCRMIGFPAEKSATLLSAAKQGVGSSSNHYFINTSELKGPVLLSSNPATDRTTKTQPTCYVLQRSHPVVQSPTTPGLGTQLPLNSQPLLAMPVSCVEKPPTLQSGHQTFLLRYVSPSKSGLFLKTQEAKVVAKTTGLCNQPNESTGNKVIYKIVTPSNSLLSNAAPMSDSQPVFLATRPQTQCFLFSPNKGNLSGGVKKFITIQNSAQKTIKESSVLHSQMIVKVQPSEAEKPILAPRPIRPPSQRKRRRKQLFDELPATGHKLRRLLNRVLPEKDSTVVWTPVAKDMERTLRLAPFSSAQQIKCPRRFQPVVVLNHPDADIPEVANIMKVVQRHRGAVTKVSLSQNTIQALADLSGNNSSTKDAVSQSDSASPRSVQSLVHERYLLKLKLKKKSKKKYKVVKTVSAQRYSVVFNCWFCGRSFYSQEDWIGHGQRHLMEATRDWNKLVNSMG